MTSEQPTLDALVQTLHGNIFDAMRQLEIPSVTQLSEKISAVRTVYYLKRMMSNAAPLDSFQIGKPPNLLLIFGSDRITQYLQRLRLLISSPIRDEIYDRLLDHIFEITKTPARYPGDPDHDLEQIQFLEGIAASDDPKPTDQRSEIPSSASFMGASNPGQQERQLDLPRMRTPDSVVSNEGIVMRIRRGGVDYTLWDLIGLFGFTITAASERLGVPRRAMVEIYQSFGFHHWPVQTNPICNLKRLLSLPISDIVQEMFTRIIKSLIAYRKETKSNWYRGCQLDDNRAIKILETRHRMSQSFEQKLSDPPRSDLS